MITADAQPVIVGLAPKVEVIASSSERANMVRAQQCPSVAVNTDPERRPDDDIMMSLFVHLDADLDEDSRTLAAEVLASRARRVRWKSNAAIVEVSTSAVVGLRGIPGVAYIENGLSLSAPNPTDSHPGQAPDIELRRVTTCEEQHKCGQDVLVGIIDVHGFDFAHPDFLDGDGHTRFEAIWDQGGDSRSPPSSTKRKGLDGFEYGALIRKGHMDAAIDAASARKMAATRLEPQSQMVPGSHGTHVASIAAGNRGVARKARLAGVLIDLGDQTENAATSFYDSTRVTDAIDYLLDLAAELGEPHGAPLCVSINISLGTNGHAHDASSLTAQWIDHALTTRGRCISVASGNSGQTEPAEAEDRNFIKGRIHASGTLLATGLRKDLVWIVEGNDTFSDVSENEMEIWYNAQDRFEVSIKPPDGTWSVPIAPTQKALNQALDNGTVVSVLSETYYPTNGWNRISIVLSPSGNNGNGASRRRVAPGEWTVRLRGLVVRDGGFDAWIERDDPRRRPGSGNEWDFPSYFAPGSYTDDRMINSLGCPERVIAVANIDAQRETVNVSSSRGPTRDGRCKPDIGADGTNVVAACGFDPRTQWKSMTGTSMASPYVCGVAALMLTANPPLTAAQIQGIMRATSTPLTGHNFSWRKDAGFGLINPHRCVEEAAGYNEALSK